jgi:non-specific serine/threonine protein kinase/serine/threonine-protein kinase
MTFLKSMPIEEHEAKVPKDRSANASLRRELSGDLDSIVLMALRKEPTRRYASVEQFSSDVRRYLDGLPVIAVKGSFRYRAGKFIKRNRVAIAAGTVLVITLAAGVIATVRQARIARRQAEIAGAERARAEKRFNDVRELANSLIFEIHDSIQGLPGATPSRKLLLDRAVKYLDKLSQDVGGDANLQRELAWAYHRLATVQGDTSQGSLGEIGAADISNKKAMALFEAVAKANPTNVTDQLNLAMAYRWRAFYDIYEKTGLEEINRALAVTDPLMKTDGNSLDVKNERAEELLILAFVQDAMGDRLKCIESFRKVAELQRQIQSARPDYPDIDSRQARVTVELAHEMGRFGSRADAAPLMQTGISQFEAILKSHPGDPRAIRELGAATTRLGDIEMLNGNIAAARHAFQEARHRVERIAKLDPENQTLQSDLWVADFEDGRALAVAGRYEEALPILQRSFQGYQSLHLEADVGPGPRTMQAWIAEAQTGTGKFDEALENLEAAAKGLAEDEANFDDARCDLAMVEAKIGNVLLKMGKRKEARTHFETALEKAKLEVSAEHNDFPALYAAAEALTGMGDVSASEARSAGSAGARGKSWTEASASYQKSLDVWKRIPNPSQLSGNDYLATLPPEVSARLAACNLELQRTASK